MRLILLIAILFYFSSAFSVGYSQSDFQKAQSNLEHLKHNHKMPHQSYNHAPKNLTLITKQRLTHKNISTKRWMDVHFPNNGYAYGKQP